MSTTFSNLALAASLSAAADDAGICIVPPATEALESLDSNGPSLVLNDPDVLAAGFSFAKTIDQIVATSPAPSTGSARLVRSMIGSYRTTETTLLNSDSDINMTLDAHPGEAALNSAALLTGDMRPVALFNRLDLAPSDGAHCGEYRIVYSKTTSSATDRFFVIFEAQYPNPTPNDGLAGCLPVADFWVSLNDKTNVEAAAALEGFFYQGIVHNDVALPAVINFDNFTSGQVRTNNFVNNADWQLREFKTAVIRNEAKFAIQTVKSNPLVALYGENLDALPANNDQATVAALLIDFKEDFVADYLPQLLNPETQGLETEATTLINAIGFSSNNKYNEFQSTASRTSDNPDRPTLVRPGFDGAIATALSTDSNPSVQVLTTEMILNRAGAMSCGGCHQFSNDKEIAPNVFWPTSRNFVHVAEDGGLSRALIDHFLPSRSMVLTDIACNRPDPS